MRGIFFAANTSGRIVVGKSGLRCFASAALVDD